MFQTFENYDILVAYRLSDDPILPMNVTDYAVRIKSEVSKLKDSAGDLMTANGISFAILDQYAERFHQAARTFEAAVNIANPTDRKLLRF